MTAYLTNHALGTNRFYTSHFSGVTPGTMTSTVSTLRYVLLAHDSIFTDIAYSNQLFIPAETYGAHVGKQQDARPP